MPHMLICGYDIGVGWMDQSDFRFPPVDIYLHDKSLFFKINILIVWNNRHLIRDASYRFPPCIIRIRNRAPNSSGPAAGPAGGIHFQDFVLAAREIIFNGCLCLQW